MNNKFYVYIHYRADNLTPFYVGKGSGNRAKVKLNRTDYWKGIVSKYGYIAQIYQDNLTEEEAYTSEKIIINQLKNNGVKLVNFKDGGDSGFRFSDEVKAKMSQTNKGRIYSIETKKKMSEAKKDKPSHRRKPTLQLDKQGNIIREWKSASEAADSLNITRGSVMNCLSGLTKTSGGFTWKYKNT